MKKLLFLDIDGVLNSMPSDHHVIDKWKQEMSQYDFYMKLYGLDKKLVDRLKLIIDRTQCKIVFSTSWRYFKDHPTVGEDWRKTLSEMLGISQEIFIGNTPDISNCGGWDMNQQRRRGLEIKYWLDNNTEPGKFKYCIIDDEIIDIINVISESHVVHTDMRFGLTLSNVDRAVKILNE